MILETTLRPRSRSPTSLPTSTSIPSQIADRYPCSPTDRPLAPSHRPLHPSTFRSVASGTSVAKPCTHCATQPMSELRSPQGHPTLGHCTALHCTTTSTCPPTPGYPAHRSPTPSSPPVLSHQEQEHSLTTTRIAPWRDAHPTISSPSATRTSTPALNAHHQ